MFIVQWRTEQGWQRPRGYKRLATALDALRQTANNSPAGTYRVVHGDRCVAMRAPAVADDPSLRWGTR